MASVFDLLGKYDNLNEPIPTLNTRPSVFALVIPFLILSWLCAAVRLHTRFIILKCPGWDDIFVVLVMITTLVLSVGTCLALNHGLGQHFILLPIDEMAGFVKAFYLPNSTYAMSTCLIKLALLFQYLRVLERGSRLRIFTICVIVFTACWGFAYSFIAWIPCWPVAAYWDWSFEAVARWGFGSHDVDVFVATYVSHVVSNVLLDIVVFSIPVPLYFNPDLTQKSKMGLCGLVALGLIVNVFSIWRLVAIIDTRAGTSPTLDPSWYGSGPIVLAALEINLALICASLPVFWPVIEHSIGKIFVTREIKISRQIEPDQDTELRTSPCQTGRSPARTGCRRKEFDVLDRWLNSPLSCQPNAMVVAVESGEPDGRGSRAGYSCETDWADDQKSTSERKLLSV